MIYSFLLEFGHNSIRPPFHPILAVLLAACLHSEKQVRKKEDFRTEKAALRQELAGIFHHLQDLEDNNAPGTTNPTTLHQVPVTRHSMFGTWCVLRICGWKPWPSLAAWWAQGALRSVFYSLRDPDRRCVGGNYLLLDETRRLDFGRSPCFRICWGSIKFGEILEMSNFLEILKI